MKVVGRDRIHGGLVAEVGAGPGSTVATAGRRRTTSEHVAKLVKSQMRSRFLEPDRLTKAEI